MGISFNSVSAKELANKNNISVEDIQTHRQDGKVTIQNVKDHIKSLKLKRKISPLKKNLPQPVTKKNMVTKKIVVPKNL